MDRHEPYNVRAEGLDTVKVGYHGAERALRGVVSDVYGIDHLILELAVGIDGHGSASFYGFVERIYVFTHGSMVLQKEKYFNTDRSVKLRFRGFGKYRRLFRRGEIEDRSPCIGHANGV